MEYVCKDPEARDFDFIIGTWQIRNKRRNKSGLWQEFDATNTGALHLDGCTVIDHYQATFLMVL